MKRKLWIFACVILLLLLPIIVFTISFVTPMCFEDTYYGELGVMYRNLQKTQGKKIVVIGNSNVAFGVDSELMEYELKESGLDYSVVNFGLYGTIGSKAMLDIAYDSISDGDIVIFTPEEEANAYSLYFNGQEVWRSADSCFELAAKAAKQNAGRLLGSYLPYLQEKVSYAKKGQKASASGIYAKSSFDENGVMKATRQSNKMVGGYDANNPVIYNETLFTQEFADYLNEYADKLKKKNAQIWFSFSPVNELALEGGIDSDGPEKLYQKLEEGLTFPIISNPYSYILDSAWFYDSNFHLNESGMDYRSLLLVQDIKNELGIRKPNETQFPQMPDSEYVSETEEGAYDNSDLDCFTFEIVEEGAVITGLTEVGKTRKEVVIPGIYEDHLIVSFEKDVFAQDQVIEEITVQSNITILRDDSFLDCKMLKKLNLRQTDPSKIQVGYGLLNGTSTCKIYVDEQSYSAYANNYFWGYYANGSLVKQSEVEGNYEDNKPTQSDEKVSLESSEICDSSSTQSVRICYELNGGNFLDRSSGDSFVEEVDLTHHTRANTSQGINRICKDGCTLTGWNTKPDGTGLHIGLGSRVTVGNNELRLYAQWEKWTDSSLFSYAVTEKGTAILTGCSLKQSVDQLVIPQQIDGYTVSAIAKGFCKNVSAEKLILPYTIESIEKEAFSDCVFSTIMLSDSLLEIYDDSFRNTIFDTLSINAATAPRYQTGNEICWFADMMDQLILKQNEKKMIFFGGCSFSYGLDSSMVDDWFQNQYQVLNMGIIGGTNAVFQLECIKSYLKEGDVLIHAPEVASAYQLYYVRSAENRMFRMVEGNYDLLTLVDMKKISGIFKTFSFYLDDRREIEEGSYSDYCDAYNSYGDIVRTRNGGIDKSYTEGYTYEIGYLTAESLSILSDSYNEMRKRGISVFFSFSPVNKTGLTKEEKEKKVWESFEQVIRNELEKAGIPVISHAEDYLYSGTFFYDTNYHLSTEGAKKRTKQLLIDLDAVLHSN